MTHPRRDYHRAWRLANPDKVAEHLRKQNATERARERKRAWARAHPEVGLRNSVMRKARMWNAPGWVTLEQIIARVEVYGGLCWICRVAPYEHLDHMIPLSSGGTNWAANIAPSCRRCNLRKGRRTLREYLMKYGLTRPSLRLPLP